MRNEEEHEDDQDALQCTRMPSNFAVPELRREKQELLVHVQQLEEEHDAALARCAQEGNATQKKKGCRLTGRGFHARAALVPMALIR